MKYTHNLDLFADFPETKTSDNDGLLSIGGDLTTTRLINAYKKGIFPWFDKPPILWWSPPIRAVFITNKFYTANSLKKTIRQKFTQQNLWEITIDNSFAQVINNCARRVNGTWINRQMINAYINLHAQGVAHSFELWEKNADDSKTLIGGLYGLLIGRVFFGESMFSLKANASKVVLYALCQWMTQNAMPIIDAQVINPHTKSLGAILLTREDFEYLIAELINVPSPKLPEKLFPQS